MKKRNIMKGKKILGLALVGVFSFSMATPVFAAAGGAGTDGTGNITVSYKSLTDTDSTITNKVGPNETVITEDFGYAWDDLSFTYVQHLGGAESTLTTDGGYAETTASFQSGEWYYGSYSNLSDLETAVTNGDSYEMPSISLAAAALNNVVVNDSEYTALPKVILHNYSGSSATYTFGVATADQSNFNTNGMLTLVNDQHRGYEVSEATGTLNNGSTVTYGVSPIGAPATKDFADFTVGLTINFS